MQMKWEYLQKDCGSDRWNAMTVESLNELGSEGWELASVVPKDLDRGTFTYFFKRQVKE